jgi:hypothetical protein
MRKIREENIKEKRVEKAKIEINQAHFSSSFILISYNII